MKTLVLILSIFLCSCNYLRNSKLHYRSTRHICNDSLYVEQFLVFNGGVYGGSTISDFLTDSVNFRIYVGTYIDDIENISFECRQDSICIDKISIEKSDTFQAIDTKVYSIKALKTGHTFH